MFSSRITAFRNICRGFEIDHQLEKHLPYAYNDTFGYLTSCPTNVGTGLRASVMMHLPALTMSKQIKVVTQMLARLGMVVRGIYGEGSENLGNIYQISNQVTLGKSEEEILEDLQNVVVQIIKNERGAREALFKNSRIVLEDRFNRSLGILKYACIMTSEEAAACLSNVRLGVDLGIIKEVPLHVLNECMITHTTKLYNNMPVQLFKQVNAICIEQNFYVKSLIRTIKS